MKKTVITNAHARMPYFLLFTTQNLYSFYIIDTLLLDLTLFSYTQDVWPITPTCSQATILQSQVLTRRHVTCGYHGL